MTHRVTKELRALENDKTLRGMIRVLEWDQHAVQAEIRGPADTPYAAGWFRVTMSYGPTYPFTPPRVHMDTKVYHPNIDWVTGSICMDLLKHSWSPAMTTTTVLLSLLSLLATPNPADPLRPDVAEIYTTDPHLFAETAALWTRTHARVAEPAFAVSPGSTR